MENASICQAPWDGVVVHFSGEVYACDSMSQGAEMKSMMLGNIREESLRDILRNEKIQTLRKGLLSGELEGFLCQTCNKSGTCNLYGDPTEGRASGERKSLSVEEPLKLRRLELGLTDLCNMRCTMCCLTRGEASPPFVSQKGMMDFSIAQKVIAEFMALADDEPLILLHWVGEPLLYPQLEAVLALLQHHSCRLHLVTNGIKLSPQYTEKLFLLPGEHTLNISLNAVRDETYQKINQVDQYSRVLENIDHWLHERERREHQNWTFMASAVVLEDNYREIGQFVPFWKEKLAPFGGADIGLNGKGLLGRNQIQVLCELEQPLSKLYFREALRLANIDHLYPEMTSWEQVDDVFFGRVTLDFTAQWGVEQLEFMLWGEWGENILGWVLQQLEEQQERLTPHLRRLAFQENRTLSTLPFSPRVNAQILLWMKLVPTAFSVLSSALQNIQWTEQDVADLAVLLHWHPELLQHLPSDLSLPRSKDASWFIIMLLQGREKILREPPQEWQVEACAAVISQCDSPHFAFGVAVELPDSLYADFLRFAADTRPETLQECCRSLDSAPAWLVRAIRRRWFFSSGGSAALSCRFPQTIQAALLALLVGDSATQKRALSFLRQRVRDSQIDDIGQDLAEIHLRRPELSDLVDWQALLELLWMQVSCPLLQFSSGYLLGVGVLLVDSPLQMSDRFTFWSQNINREDLLPWQREQWEHLAQRLISE